MSDSGNGEQSYEEREAVAVFDSEASLRAAVDDLMQLGLRQEDMSVLAESSKAAGPAEKLADAPGTPRAAYVTSDSRTEGLAGLVGLPVYLAGAGAAALAATGGMALVPAIAVAAGSGIAAGGFGLLLARAFGRRHAAYIQEQIENGGLILWVSAPDRSRDARIAEILTRHGGRDVHFHVVTRSWGVADVPLHDVQPDPLLR